MEKYHKPQENLVTLSTYVSLFSLVKWSVNTVLFSRALCCVPNSSCVRGIAFWRDITREKKRTNPWVFGEPYALKIVGKWRDNRVGIACFFRSSALTESQAQATDIPILWECWRKQLIGFSVSPCTVSEKIDRKNAPSVNSKKNSP